MRSAEKRAAVSALVFLIGCAMMAFGAYRGELGIVLNKAVNICLECIGLG